MSRVLRLLGSAEKVSPVYASLMEDSSGLALWVEDAAGNRQKVARLEVGNGDYLRLTLIPMNTAIADTLRIARGGAGGSLMGSASLISTR